MAKPRARIVHLVSNPRAGRGTGAGLEETARQKAESLDGRLFLHPLGDDDDGHRRIADAVASARADGGIVVTAGGDGTLRSVAEAAAHACVPFAAIPCGTFNFFARSQGVPESGDAALELAFVGELRPVRLGRVNDRDFLINTNVGFYATALRAREKTSRWLGRTRIVGALASALALLKRFRPMDVELVADGKRERRRTLSIFVGNNALQLRGLALDVARCLNDDHLAVVLLKPMGLAERLRVLWRGIARTLEKEENIESFCVDSLTIHLPWRRAPVALDGELFFLESPFVVRAMPNRLRMALPPREPAA